MYVIYIRNYKKSILMWAFVALLWAVIILFSKSLLHKGLTFHLTISDFLEFSYPYGLQVEGIYINEDLSYNTIQTSSNINKATVGKFSTYKSLEGKFSFNYPSAFQLNPEDFTGSEILYHIGFHDKENITHGFVQVWKLSGPLDTFLENSKKMSLGEYEYFHSSAVNINNIPGFYWDYIVKDDDKKTYKGSEVFLQKEDGKMFRISYFVPKKLWNEEKSDIFWHMVYTFKVH